MTWARIDDRFPMHRKIRRLSDAAFRLHVSAICWANEHLTNGYIPFEELDLIGDVKRPEQAAAELVSRGVWDLTDFAWVIHDFLEYNEPREKVLARREADAERKRKGRSGRDSTTDSAGSPAGHRSDSGRPVPGPSRTPKSLSADAAKTRGCEHHVGKPRTDCGNCLPTPQPPPVHLVLAEQDRLAREA